MTRQPALHRAPIGYGRNGPLTCVAECDLPPTHAQLAIARWMIENGSDVHQGGDGPLMRAALCGDRIPMMELLVSMGADVNAMWDGSFPIIFAACEGVEPASLKWLLNHGANPNAADREGTSALDYVISSATIAKQTHLLKHRLLPWCPDQGLRLLKQLERFVPAAQRLGPRQPRAGEGARADAPLLRHADRRCRRPAEVTPQGRQAVSQHAEEREQDLCPAAESGRRGAEGDPGRACARAVALTSTWRRCFYFTEMVTIFVPSSIWSTSSMPCVTYANTV